MKEEEATALPPHPVLHQAAHWFAILSDAEVSGEDVRQWQSWLEDHPEHRRAWQYVEQVGKRFQLAQERAGRKGASTILNTSRRNRVTRRRLLEGGAIGLMAWLGWRYTPLPTVAQDLANTWTADYHTAVGEIRQFTLADGGQLWLNSDSAVDIRYQESVREIRLHQGEILIQTGKDPARRPFQVTNRHGTLRALGTRFTVQQRDTGTLLAVYEGAVAITTQQGATRTLHHNQQTVFDAHHVQVPGGAQRAREAWRNGLIVADNLPLEELAAELGRYRHGYLGVDPAVAKITVTGSFPAHKPDHALAMLADALPVRIQRRLPWWVSVVPAE